MSEADVTAVRGAGGGGGKGKSTASARAPYEAPNTLRSRATAYVMDILGEGQIEGFADGLKSIFFEDTPLQAADGSFNFQGVNLVLMAGFPDQQPPAGYAAELNSREVAVGLQVTKKNGPIIRTINTTPMTRARVTIRIPALYQQDKNSGDINGFNLVFSVDTKAIDSGWIMVAWETINGKCTSPYEKSLTFPLQGTGPWQIRVTRQSDDHDDDSSLQDALYWASYTEILDYRLSYPDTAYVGMALDAELFGGTVPRRTYQIKGRKMLLPENYDPIARTYATSGPGTSGGVWNGSLAKHAWSDNPAWIFYDLLTDTRFGLGAQIKPHMVDKWALYEIARYCDQLVPDGRGGWEPRFTFNGVINTREDAYSVLQAVAATFRGMVYWGAGTITATQDRPASPVKLVTNANVEGGAFTYEGTALRARHTMANVMFSDSEDGFKPDIEPVPGKDIGRRGVVPIEIVGLGISKRTQARRLGRWTLDVEQNETQTCTYRGGWDQVDVRPGDLILVADRWWQGARFGGRIRAVAGTYVTLDSPVILDGSEAYLKATLPDGTIEERRVITGAGTYSEITLNSAFSQTPQPDSVWLLALGTVQPRPHRVISVAEVDKHLYEISALFHDATKYDRIDFNINRAPPSFSLFPTGALAPPSDLSFEEYQIITNGAVRAMMTVSWKHSTDARVRSYTVEVKRPQDPAYTRIGDAYGNSIDVADVTDGTASVRVRSVDALGRVSAWHERTGITLVGLKWVPDNVATFGAEVIDGVLRLSWNGVRQHKSVVYRIKYTPSLAAPAWQSAATLVEGVDGLHFDAPPRDGAYLIKAVSLAGVECLGAAEVLTNAVSLSRYNVVAELTEDPDWTGVKVGTMLDTSRLILAPDQLSGTYVFNGPDIGDASLTRVTASIEAYGVTSNDFLAQWPTLADVPRLASGGGADWSASLEFRTTLDDPAEEGWSEWRPFSMADVEARAMQFRLTIASLDGGATKVEVASVKVIIDVPDRVEAANDVTVAAAGMNVTFAEAFRVTPAIAVTGQDLATGDYWAITAQNRTGFTVRFYNAAGSGVERTADWIAKGYGREYSVTSRKHFRAALGGVGTLNAAAPIHGKGAEAALTGAGTIAAITPGQCVAMTATLSGAGTISVVPRPKYRASATLAGEGRLRSWIRDKMGNAELVGTGTLAADARATVRPSAVLGGAGMLTANPRAVLKLAATLGGQGSLFATPRALLRPTAALGGMGRIDALSTTMTKWDFSQGTMPGGITFARGTKAWYFAAPADGGRPALTEAAIDTPTFDWDPAKQFNSGLNPWQDGATVGTPGTTPTSWSRSAPAGWIWQTVGTGVENGIPYVDYRLYTPTTGNQNNAPIYFASGLTVLNGETWTMGAYVKVVAGSFAGMQLRFFIANMSGAQAVMSAPPTSGDLKDCLLTKSWTFGADATSQNASITIYTPASGSSGDVTIRVGFPILNKGAASLLASAGFDALSPRNGSSVPLYGLRGLMIRRKTDNLNKNPRGEGATAGTPGSDPTGWSVTATGGMSKQTYVPGSLDGIPYARIRLSGTAGGGDGTLLASVYAWGDTTTGTYGRHAGTTGEVVCPSAFLGILDAEPAVKARFAIAEYDTGGSLLGTTYGAWQSLLRVRSTGAEDGLGARRLYEAVTLVRAGTATFQAFLEVANASGTTALDLSLLVGTPQLTKTRYPTAIALPDAGSPATATVERDIPYVSVGGIPYDGSLGVMLAARFELMRGAARLTGNSDILTFGASENADGYSLTFNDSGASNRFQAVKIRSGVFDQKTFGTVQAVSGQQQFAASWAPGSTRYAATGNAEAAGAPSSGLVASIGGPNVVFGGWTTGTTAAGKDNRQIDGWIMKAAIYSVPNDVPGVVEHIPG